MRKKETLTVKIANSICSDLLSAREISPGEYLPAERDLAEQFKVSRVTIRQSLKQLMNKGILEVIPCKGYRFLKAAPGPKLSSLAYIVDTVKPDEPLDPISEQVISALNRILLPRNQQMLSLGIKGVEPDDDFFSSLKDSRVNGIALDCGRPEFVDAASKRSLPCVLVDAYTENSQIDSVIQENYYGAFKAVQYLLAKKHTKIAWLGPTRGNAHYRERYSGARAALEDAGLDFHACFTNTGPGLKKAKNEAEAFLEHLLGKKSRPTACVCMWQPLAESTADAARKAGLTIGKDIEIVGWATDSEYRDNIIPEFLNATVPATMIWSPQEMAGAVLELLDRRMKKPEAPFVRVEVKVRLQEPQDANKALTRKRFT